MKRSRNESVTYALSSYLRKRKYTDQETFKKSNIKFNLSLDEMAMNHFTLKDVSMKNVLTFSSINADSNVVDQQFNRLKGFVGDSTEPMKSELTFLLFPVYLYLHMELVTSNQVPAAQKFYQKYAFLFVGKPAYKAVLDDMVVIHSDKNLENNATFAMLKSNQFEVSLTSSTLQYLLRFLKNYKQTVLLQILNLHIYVKVLPDGELPEVPSTEESGTPEAPVGDKKEIKADNSSKDSEDAAMNKLMNAIKNVRMAPPSLPPICHYAVPSPSIGVSSVNLAHDQSKFAAGFEDSSIRIWNLTPTPFDPQPSNTNISHLRLGHDVSDEMKYDSSGTESPSVKVLRAHSGVVFGLQFVPKSHTLLSCSEDTSVRAWDLNTFSNVSIYHGHNYPIWCLDVSPLGLYFATGSRDHTARLWSLDRTHPIRLFTGHNLDVDSVKFHPNCNYLATGSSDRTVRLWSVQDGNMVRSFCGHRGSIMALAFSPDGKLLASAGEDKKIKIWDIASGSILKEFRGHTDVVYVLEFSPDSSILASGGADDCVRLWDTSKIGTSSSSSSESHVTWECLHHQPIKSTLVHFLRYSKNNVLYSSGTLST